MDYEELFRIANSMKEQFEKDIEYIAYVERASVERASKPNSMVLSNSRVCLLDDEC